MRRILLVLVLLLAGCKGPKSDLEPYDQPVEGALFHDGTNE